MPTTWCLDLSALSGVIAQLTNYDHPPTQVKIEISSPESGAQNYSLARSGSAESVSFVLVSVTSACSLRVSGFVQLHKI